MELLVVIVVTVVAVAAVIYPLLRGDAGSASIEAEQDESSGAAVEQDIARYRAALSARTLCRRCGFANPEGSVFCADCGRRLDAGRSRDRSAR